MKKILLSLLVASLSLSAGSITLKTENVKWYPKKESAQCSPTKELVESAFDSKFKTDADAIKFLSKDFSKKDCKVQEIMGGTSIICEKEQIDLMLFPSKASCEKWNKFIEDNKENTNIDTSAMTGNPHLFFYAYLPQEDTCAIAKDAFNDIMKQNEATKKLIVSTQQEYVNTLSRIWKTNSSDVKITLYGTAATVEVFDKGQGGDITSYFFADSNENCQKMRNILKNTN